MISFDSNVLIYALEGDSEFADLAASVIKRAEKEGAVVSVLLRQEVLTGAALFIPQSFDEIQGALDEQLLLTKFVPVTMPIADRALGLTRKHGRRVQGYDAIHLATAIEHGAETFYTNDQTLLKLQIPELRITPLTSQS